MIDMKIIQWLSDKIEDEINDANVYCTKALMLKETMPKLADTLEKLSEEELKHMAMLHNEVVDIIEEYRKKDGEPPADMLAIYDYLHKRQINKSAEVKAMQSMYRA